MAGESHDVKQGNSGRTSVGNEKEVTESEAPTYAPDREMKATTRGCEHC